jgi:hypothetical protein
MGAAVVEDAAADANDFGAMVCREVAAEVCGQCSLSNEIVEKCLICDVLLKRS